MALIKCPDCGKDVSSLASACIHCGRPLDIPAGQGALSTTPNPSLTEEAHSAQAAELGSHTGVPAKNVSKINPEPTTGGEISYVRIFVGLVISLVLLIAIASAVFSGSGGSAVTSVGSVTDPGAIPEPPTGTNSSTSDTPSHEVPTDASSLTSGSTSQSGDDSLAFKIASMDGDPGESTRISSLLSQLASTFGITETEVGDMTTTGRDVLKEKGVSATYLQILGIINRIDVRGHTGHDVYAMMVTVYVGDRNKGLSDEESEKHLQEAVNAADTLTN